MILASEMRGEPATHAQKPVVLKLSQLSIEINKHAKYKFK